MFESLQRTSRDDDDPPSSSYILYKVEAGHGRQVQLGNKAVDDLC